MIKKIFSFTLFTLLFGVSFAYSPLNKVQHQQIDLQLSGFSNLSKSEKSKEADFFLRLAQKSLEIRQAFSGGKGKIPGAKLTEIDKQSSSKNSLTSKKPSSCLRNSEGASKSNHLLAFKDTEKQKSLLHSTECQKTILLFISS